MSRLKILTVATAAFIAAGAAGGTVTAQAAPVPTGTSGWVSATLPVNDTVLTGAAQPDPQTTWAAGFRISSVGKASVRTPVLLTRKASDPRGWVNTATAPLPSGAETRFNAVTAVSSGDGWIVGDDSPQAGGIVTERWDGAAWKLISAPVPTKTYSDSAGLLGASGLAGNDAWAVGWAQILDSTTPDPNGGPPIDQTHMEGLAEHWNGTRWVLQRLPTVPGGFTLSAVTEISADNVWAAGYSTDDQPVLFHYDGRTWTEVPTPQYTGLNGEFNAIAADGADDVWAVGRVVRDATDTGHALVEHWDGHTWQQVATPDAAGRLSAVTITPQGVVAVGRTTKAAYPGPGADGYAMRFSGGNWRSLGLPSGTLFDPNSVVVSPQDQTTIVGDVADPTQANPQPMVLTGSN